MSAFIQATNLRKSFGSKLVLDNINFELSAGEPIALIGPNGAGKTTLFSIMCGYLTPDTGDIKLLGHTPGSSALFGRVGALPQDALFDPNFSLLNQLSFYAQLQGMNKARADADAMRVLTLVDLADCAKQKATSLSHGMKKRLSIAQALLGEPELVLLDEPTAGLDPMNALQIRQLIAKMSEQATFVISSHNLFELERLCGTILYLEHGKLVQQRTINTKVSQGFLTLTLEQGESAQVLKELALVSGVNKVDCQQKNEYLIWFDAELAPDTDLAVLQALRSHGWRYKSLQRGQSLEQQLFAVANG